MDRRKLIKSSIIGSDSPVANGVFMESDGDHELYDVRKAAAYFSDLSLKPGDELPEEYKKLCVL